MNPQSEPALKLYLFGEAWRDCRSVAKTAWDECVASAKKQAKQGEDAVASAKKPGVQGREAVAFHYAASFGVSVGGAICISLFSLCHVIALLLGLSALCVALFPLIILEWFRQAIQKISFQCPECYHHSAIPAYECSGCQRLHFQLTPNQFGIARHECLCHTKLPSLWWSRRLLLSRCPICKTDVACAEVRRICIPLAGGSEHGKTEFLYRACVSLIHAERARNWTLKAHDSEDEKTLAELARQADSGRMHKTAATQPRPIRFNVVFGKRTPPREISFFDPAGEVFHSDTDRDRHRFYQYIRGIVFLIDPFTLPRLRTLLAGQSSEQLRGFRAAESDAVIVLEGLCRSLEHFGKIKHGCRCSLPIAIVLTKGDAFSLAAVIMKSSGGNTSVDAACQAYLLKNGGEKLLNDIDSTFANYRFFIAAREDPRMPERLPPDARDAAASVRWLLEFADSKFK